MFKQEQEVEIWQCENCHDIKHKEEEVLCWQCGQGEMIYLGKKWMPVTSVEYQPDTRSFWRRVFEFPFRLFLARD